MSNQTAPNIEYRKQVLKVLEENRNRLDAFLTEIGELPLVPNIPEISWNGTINMGITASVIVGLLFVFHCIIWVLKLIFDISWDTWEWTSTAFWWGLGLVAIVAAYECIQYLYRKSVRESIVDKYAQLETNVITTEHNIQESERKITESLVDDIKRIVEIPLSQDAIKLEEQDDIEQQLYNFYVLYQNECSENEPKKKSKLREDVFSAKLRMFYALSIKGEARNTYSLFEEQLSTSISTKNISLLRTEVNIPSINKSLYRLAEFTKLLNNNKMSPILNRLSSLKNKDTSNWLGFTSTSKMAELTEGLQKLLKEAKFEYEELASINQDISYLLEYVRVCAYRNIYLGAELLNYIRDNAGGKNLTTEKGLVELDVRPVDVNVLSSSLRMDVIGNISATAEQSISRGIELIKNSKVQEFIAKNPKTAIGLAIGETLLEGTINYINERSDKIEKNNEIQENVIECIRTLADNYTNGQGALLRSIEIIKAIVKANEGFMKVYNPLKKKVFDSSDAKSVSIKDVQQLALATNEYNKISKAKL